MQRVRKWLATCAVVTCAAFASEAQADGGTVTLAEVVRMAQVDPPRVLQALATLERRTAEVRQAEGQYLPTFLAEGSGTVGYDDRPVAPGLNLNYGYKTVGARAVADWAIVSLSRRHTVASARKQRESDERSSVDIKRQAVAAAVELYVRALATSSLIDDAKLTLDRRSQQFTAIQSLVRAGIRPSVDETRAQVEAVSARYRLDARRVEQRSALAALAAALGRDPEQGAVPQTLSGDPFVGPNSIDDAVRAAIAARPDLQRLQRALEARQEDVRAAVMRRVPILGVSANASVSYIDPILAWTKALPSYRDNEGNLFVDADGNPEQRPVKSAISGQQTSLSGILYLRWTGLDATVIRSADVARGAMLETQRALEVAILDVRAQVVDAVLAVERAQKEMERATEVLTAAGATREAQLGRYKAGVASLLDLLDAEQLEQNARLARIEATRDHDVARVRLLAATGKVEQLR